MSGTPAQQFLEEMARIGTVDLDNVFRSADGHDLAATITPMRSKVDDPVGRLDNFKIVLDDHDCIALINELMQHFEQLRHVVEMQARGWLVEDIEGAARGLA